MALPAASEPRVGLGIPCSALGSVFAHHKVRGRCAECATRFRPGGQKAQPLGRHANLTPIFTEVRLSKTQAHGLVATRPPYSEKTLWMSQFLFPIIWPTI